ncbi:MAG: signal recognition particle-docking protein FtsY [Candidatus Woesearchaeota archaeon]
MFGFLKDKLKGALGKLTKEVEKESVIEKKEVLVEKKIEKEEKIIKTENKTKEIIVDEAPKIVEKKKGFFQKIFGKRDEEEIIEEKEELRKEAESTIIEPEKSKIIIKKEIEKPKEQIKEKINPIQKKETILVKEKDKKTILKSEIEIPINDTPINVTKKDPITEPIHKDILDVPKKLEKPIVHENTKISKTEKIPKEVIESKNIEISKPIITEKIEPKIVEKPRHQVLEEERAKKTVEEPIKEERKGFFTKITETFTKIQISEEKFEELFWELEVILLENNVAVEVIDKIKRDLKKELLTGKVSRKSVEDLILATLKQSITELFDVEKIDLIANIKNKRKVGKPYVISIIGVNGSGKTTSIAKLTHKFQKEKLSVVLAASDTFRAAAIQQLEEHANKLDVKIIKHDYNSDPAAVAFDAIKYAEAKNIDVVLIDTAGRLHSNTNLMRELEKVIRVCKPDIKIFVGESITGNDCVEQAKEFDKAVGIDAIILAKADVDDKGGAAISVSYILQRPILYLGVGQTYDDLKEFDSNIIIENLGL